MTLTYSKSAATSTYYLRTSTRLGIEYACAVIIVWCGRYQKTLLFAVTLDVSNCSVKSNRVREFRTLLRGANIDMWTRLVGDVSFWCCCFPLVYYRCLHTDATIHRLTTDDRHAGRQASQAAVNFVQWMHRVWNDRRWIFNHSYVTVIYSLISVGPLTRRSFNLS